MPIRQGGNLPKNSCIWLRLICLFEHRLLSSVDAMHLEDGLGEINSDRANLHVDVPLTVIRL